jgi:DNA adenine methylase
MRSFLSYIGGKSRLAGEIAARLPQARCYVEVFGGAAWVLFARDPSPIEILNDLDGRLVNLYRVVRDRPGALARELALFPRSRVLYRELCAAPTPGRAVRAAAVHYFLLKNAFSGRAGNGFSASDVWARRLNRVTVEELDFAECLKRYDAPDAVFYLDPPYVSKERFYAHFKAEDHERLRNALENVQGRWLLSYNDCQAVRHLYRGFKRVRAATSYCAGRGGSRPAQNELLISNY